MARGQTRSNRKLTVTPLRCRDRRLVHRPFGADSLGGSGGGMCGVRHLQDMLNYNNLIAGSFTRSGEAASYCAYLRSRFLISS